MTNAKRALLLEDNDIDAAITCRLLEKCSHQHFDVVRCVCLSEAVEKLTHSDFDVALIDLNVPDSEGLDTVREALRAGPNTAMIVLTGSSETELAIEALEMGAQDFLPKSAISEHVLDRVIQYSVRRKNKENALAEKAYIDNLTGLGNRALLVEQWERCLGRSSRSMRKTGVLLIDINKFKQVNDEFGHNAGDILLKDVAERLKTFVRKSDLVIRLGGDEFVIVVENVRTKVEVDALRDLLMTKFGGHIRVDEDHIDYTLSVGSALSAPVDHEELTAALHRADLEMYAFKTGELKPADSKEVEQTPQRAAS